MGFPKSVNYGKRALVETAMFRYQIRIGPRLGARTLPAQKSEARLSRVALAWNQPWQEGW